MANHPQHQEMKDALNNGIINGMVMLMAHPQRTSSALVCCCTSLFQVFLANFLVIVLDPNVKNFYFRRRRDSVWYAAGIRQLEEVVSTSLLSISN